MTASTSDLDRALLRELLRTLQLLNANHFGNQLRRTSVSLVEVKSFWARWVPATRVIEVSRKLVHEQPWTVVVEVLKHELAHQFVHEILKEDEAPHGPAFQRVCQRLGIDAKSAGLPQNSALSDDTRRVVERVEKLLALAQSDNRHEAESAAATAQKLMLKYNLSESARDAAPRYGFRQLGRITGRTQEWERRLGNLLSEHFFVDVIWVPAFRAQEGKRGHVLEAIGSEANLSLAEYVYDFVSRSAERMWQAHKRAHHIRGNADRRAYLSGVIAGFAEKLTAQQARHQAQGLVWVPDAARSEYVRKRHPHVRSVSHRGHGNREAFGHGRRAGRDLVLHRGIERGARASQRLLPG